MSRKLFVLMLMVVFVTTFLTACGGGSSDSLIGPDTEIKDEVVYDVQGDLTGFINTQAPLKVSAQSLDNYLVKVLGDDPSENDVLDFDSDNNKFKGKVKYKPVFIIVYSVDIYNNSSMLAGITLNIDINESAQIEFDFKRNQDGSIDANYQIGEDVYEETNPESIQVTIKTIYNESLDMTFYTLFGMYSMDIDNAKPVSKEFVYSIKTENQDISYYEETDEYFNVNDGSSIKGFDRALIDGEYITTNIGNFIKIQNEFQGQYSVLYYTLDGKIVPENLVYGQYVDSLYIDRKSIIMKNSEGYPIGYQNPENYNMYTCTPIIFSANELVIIDGDVYFGRDNCYPRYTKYDTCTIFDDLSVQINQNTVLIDRIPLTSEVYYLVDNEKFKVIDDIPYKITGNYTDGFEITDEILTDVIVPETQYEYLNDIINDPEIIQEDTLEVISMNIVRNNNGIYDVYYEVDREVASNIVLEYSAEGVDEFIRPVLFGLGVEDNIYHWDSFDTIKENVDVIVRIKAFPIPDPQNIESDYYYSDVININNSFIQLNNVLNFDSRYGHRCMNTGNNIMITGGVSSVSSPSNDILISDNGYNWSISEGPFPVRGFHSMVNFDNKAWVIGGSNAAGAMNDIWTYSYITSTWEEVIPTNVFSPRERHTSVIFDNKIWVIGGADFMGESYSDVWCSSDGINWECKTSTAEFGKVVGHSSFVFNGKIWLLGGADNSNFNNITDYKTIWNSEDGIVWNEVCSNPPFGNIINHDTIVFNDKIYIWGKSTTDIADTKVWMSEDGVNWIRILDNEDFPLRSHCTTTFMNDQMYILGGLDENNNRIDDIWIFKP